MPATNSRISHREKQHRDLERSKLRVNRRKDVIALQRTMAFKRWLALLILTPLALVSGLTLFEMMWRAITRLGVWRTEEFIFFSVGGLVWGLSYLGGWQPVRAYVLGHELSHLVVARLFGGEILGFKVTAEGGYVETNKSNTWISLAPYLLPFYSIVILVLFGLSGLIWNLHRASVLEVGDILVRLKPVWFFYMAVGFTWCFHLTYTIKTVRAEQSDLKRNGEYFSMMLIFLINVALLVALYLAASPTPGLGLLEIWRCWKGTAHDLFTLGFA